MSYPEFKRFMVNQFFHIKKIQKVKETTLKNDGIADKLKTTADITRHIFKSRATGKKSITEQEFERL
jgi:hypothetical protein